MKKRSFLFAFLCLTVVLPPRAEADFHGFAIRSEKKALNEETAAFFELLKSGTAAQIEKALRNGVNVNSRNLEGDTPLAYAVINGRETDILRLLIKNGAHIFSSGFNGKERQCLPISVLR